MPAGPPPHVPPPGAGWARSPGIRVRRREIVLGIVAVVLLAVATGYAALETTVAGVEAAADRSGVPRPSPLVPDPGASDDLAPDGFEIRITALRVGDCLAEVPEDDDAGLISAAMVTDCGVLHVAEVFDQFSVPAERWPGTAAVARSADERCARSLSTRLGADVFDTPIDLLSLLPLEETYRWDDEVICIAILPFPRIGSLGRFDPSVGIDGYVGLAALTAGECGALPDDRTWVVARVPCRDAAAIESLGRVPVLRTGEWPGADVVDAEAERRCAELRRRHDGAIDDPLTYWLVPDDLAWARGHRTITCLVVDEATADAFDAFHTLTEGVEPSET